MKLSKGYKLGLLALGVVILSSCTASFCSNTDVARMLYAYDNGLVEGEKNDRLTALIEKAEAEEILVPEEIFWEKMDERVLTSARQEASLNGLPNLSDNEALAQFGYVKFLGPNDNLWGNWNIWVGQINAELPTGQGAIAEFRTFYQSELNAAVANFRSCITTTTGNFGPDGEFFFEGKTWGEAFSRGLIEGLFVYPVAFLIESFNNIFSGGIPGLGQVLAILFTTVIVRGVMILATFKSTLATQKMTLLQPEIAKLQNKYPNSNTNQFERQRMAQEQWALYKKHGVNPFNQIVVAFVQFPVFIAVWGAMTGSAVLATGSFLGLNLSSPLGSVITSSWFQGRWWTAVVIFLLMTGAQFLAMKLPMWLQKKSRVKVGSTVKSNAANASQSQANMISNVMFVMILVMGFSLPSAMGIYWFIGALISLAQTLITRKLMVVR